MFDFAVVIPTVRRPALVTQAVDSVLAQTTAAAEIIVVVDGFDDDTKLALQDRMVRIVEQDPTGVAGARNRGIRETSARWLCFLDDDDLWHPDRLKVTADYLSKHTMCCAVTAGYFTFAAEPARGVDLVADDLTGCLAAMATAAPVTDMGYLSISGRSFDLLLERNRSNTPTGTVRRDVLERAGGFPLGYSCAEDWVMALNVARYTEWEYMPKRLAFVRQHGDQNTRTNITNGLVALRAIRAVWDDKTRPIPAHRPLSGYSEAYRWHVQHTLWASARAQRWDITAAAWRVGWTLLPRWRDRWFSLMPPPLTWRLGRASAILRTRLSQIRAAFGDS
jgi:glycosyltransferase involved in cell wall biosynthesis